MLFTWIPLSCWCIWCRHHAGVDRHGNLFIQIFIYRWYTKVAVANKFQQKNIFNYTNNKLDIVVKLGYLQIKHPQSIFPKFLILVLNSKTELLDLTLAGKTDVLHSHKCVEDIVICAGVGNVVFSVNVLTMYSSARVWF